MKASELIEELQKKIAKYGDLDVMEFDDNEGFYNSLNVVEIHSVSTPTEEDEDLETVVFILGN